MDVAFAEKTGRRPEMHELPGTTRHWPADIVLLAMGFIGPESDTIVDHYGLSLSDNGTLATDAPA